MIRFQIKPHLFLICDMERSGQDEMHLVCVIIDLGEQTKLHGVEQSR